MGKEYRDQKSGPARDAVSTDDTQESTLDKLSREAHLLKDGLLGGMKEGFKESVHDPGGTALRLAGSIGIGLVLGAAQKSTGIVGIGAEMLGIGMTGSFAADVAGPGRWSNMCDAMSSTWQSSKNYDLNVKELQNSAGRFAFDTMLTLGVGSATAKLTQGAFLPREATLDEVVAGKVSPAAPDLQATIAGKTPLKEVPRPEVVARAPLERIASVVAAAPDSIETVRPRSTSFEKPQLRELNAEELAGLSARIKANWVKVAASPEMIAAARKDINTHGTDPVAGLTGLLRENRILGMGEKHYRLNSHREFAADIMPELKKAGATHLALEIYAKNQHILDRYEKTGVFTKYDGEAIAGLLKDESFQRLLKSARDNGIKLVAVDTDNGWRDGHMAKKIGEILDKDPNNKVVFWVGSQHLEKFDAYGKTAYQLLSPKYSFATVRDVIQDFRPGLNFPLFTATRDLTSPTLVKTSDAPGVANFPTTSGTYKPWDYVLLHPAKVPSLDTDIPSLASVAALKSKTTIRRDLSSSGTADQSSVRYRAT